jgi:Repeat of unknown function (DUF5907)
MPLGSAPKSKIDIDFTRAQGVNSSGQIIFYPNRQRVGTTMLSEERVPVDVVNGVAQVDLVRLPAGTYHVVEKIDNRPSYEFDFALPLSAADLIQYEEIAQVRPVPTTFTVVKSVNGTPPNPTTGDVILTGSAPDASPSVKGLVQLAGDLTGTAAAPTLSSARSAEISSKYVKPVGGIPSADLTTAVQTSLTKADSSVQPSDLSSAVSAVVALIPDSPNDIGAQPVDSDLTTISSLAPPDGSLLARVAGAWAGLAKGANGTFLGVSGGLLGFYTPEGGSGGAPPDRVVRVADHSKQDAGNTYDMANTDNAWLLFAGGPGEYTIAAAVGDDIEVAYNYLIAGAVTSFVDLAVVTGGTPTPQRYLSSGIATPSFQGNAGNYPTDANFQGRTGVLGFTVQSGDLDTGNVRLRWVIKTSTTNGKMYANDNYPLMLRIRNKRLSGL